MQELGLKLCRWRDLPPVLAEAFGKRCPIQGNQHGSMKMCGGSFFSTASLWYINVCLGIRMLCLHDKLSVHPLLANERNPVTQLFCSCLC